MREELLLLALVVGAFTWAFRALPTILLKSEPKEGGVMARFLAATGPAAIATLFVAATVPQLYPEPRDIVPLIMGIIATVLGFLPKRSVVVATLLGATAYGFGYWVTQ